MKRIGIILLAALLIMSSACGEANWKKLTYAENGYLYDEDGSLQGCDYAIYEPWQQAEWEAGRATTATYIAPAYVVDGITYNQFGVVCGYTDEHTPNEARYWTTNKDPYYHKAEDCDGGTKYPISAESAEVFEKRVCPACMLILDPQYHTEEETGYEADGTTPSDIEGYAGEYTNENGEMVYLLADRETYNFTSRIKGNYWLITAKYSLNQLNEAMNRINAAAEADPQLKATILSIEISNQDNAVLLTLLNPEADEKLQSLDLPTCVRIRYDRNPPL